MINLSAATPLEFPANLDAEQAVLGAILASNGECLDHLPGLEAADFFTEHHRTIFTAAWSLVERGEPVDIITLAEELRRSEQLDVIGGPAQLALLETLAGLSMNVGSYARLIIDARLKRDVMRAGKLLSDEASNGIGPAGLSQRLRDLAAHLDRRAAPGQIGASSDSAAYIETLADFFADEEPPLEEIFPELLPHGVIMLIHGEARARKSLAAFELALSASTGTAPFGLERFRPSAAISVLYIQEEDPRSLTRPRLRRLVRERCGDIMPTTLHVSVRRGVDLDDPAWVARLIEDLKRLGARLLVLDAARRFSAKTDEGPTKVRELTAILRSIVTTAGVTIVIVHHDVKPPTNGQDQRRRSQRASGGDWFAACECPVHVEKVGEAESLVFPQDFKFSSDPAPFTFECEVDGGLIARLVGVDTTTDHAERAGIRGKLMAWLQANGPASKTAMKKAGLGRWETLEAALDGLLRENRIDAGPGRKAGTHLYFVVGSPGSHVQ